MEFVDQPSSGKGRASGQPSSQTPVPASGGKVPPQALELEQAVLGAIILERDAYAKVSNILRPDVFYKIAHQKIFEAIVALEEEEEPIDLHTLTQKLRKLDFLEDVGGAVYLAELTGRVTGAANLEFHAHIILEKFIRRQLIGIMSDLQTDAYDETQDIFDLLDDSERELYELSGDNLRREAISMEELTEMTLDHLEQLRQKDETITGISSGFARLDELTSGWQPSDLIIVAARPAMGKSAFMLSLSRHAAVERNTGVLIFTLEMSAQQLAQRLLVTEAELDSQKVRTGKLESYEWEQLMNKTDRLSRAPIYIDDTPGLSIYDMRAKCRRLKAEKGISMIIIDYLQLMSAGEGKNNGNREQEIAKISRSLKMLAKELNVPVIALAQLSRAVEARPDKRPMLSDLRESGSIEQDADMVMFLYRAEYYNLEVDEEGNSTAGICEVIVGKQRNGPVGSAKLQFIDKFGKFADMQESSMGFDGSLDGGYTTGGFDISPSAPSDAESMTFPSKMNDGKESGDSGDGFADEDDAFDTPF